MTGLVDRRIRLGMVGGGPGAFIGAVHRLAARMDDHYVLKAGAFSSDPARSKSQGTELGLPNERIYSDYRAMAEAERSLPDGIEAVSIVTPNHLHVPVALAFIEAGIHVICDKPLATSLAEARKLEAALARHADVIFAMTYIYSGYPMIRLARDMVADGVIGAIRVVQVEYAQDWLVEDLEASGHKQAAWRTDSAQSGLGGAIGDIGTHAAHLACFVSGLALEEVSASLASVVPGRRLDDDAQVLLKFTGGVRGMLWASQVASGNENNLKLRLYGSKGGLEWDHRDPNVLLHAPLNEASRRLTRGGPGQSNSPANTIRIPAGHPEGFLEAFANIYADASDAIMARRGQTTSRMAVRCPGLPDGLAGMAFIEACIESSARRGVWMKLDRR